MDGCFILPRIKSALGKVRGIVARRRRQRDSNAALAHSSPHIVPLISMPNMLSFFSHSLSARFGGAHTTSIEPPICLTSAMTSRPSPLQPTKRLPKPGLQGPEKQLLDAKLLEMQLGLLCLDEVRRRGKRAGGRAS